jgi:hypothetical protein
VAIPVLVGVAASIPLLHCTVPAGQKEGGPESKLDERKANGEVGLEDILLPPTHDKHRYFLRDFRAEGRVIRKVVYKARYEAPAGDEDDSIEYELGGYIWRDGMHGGSEFVDLILVRICSGVCHVRVVPLVSPRHGIVDVGYGGRSVLDLSADEFASIRVRLAPLRLHAVETKDSGE